MIKDTVTENRELTEVVCTAVASVPGSSAKRQKTAEALLNHPGGPDQDQEYHERL